MPGESPLVRAGFRIPQMNAGVETRTSERASIWAERDA